MYLGGRNTERKCSVFFLCKFNLKKIINLIIMIMIMIMIIMINRKVERPNKHEKKIYERSGQDGLCS